MANKVVFPGDGSVQTALKKINNEVEGAHFLVIGYSDKVTLCVVAEGPGGLDAARAHLPLDTERYILLRIDHKVEMARTVKFAFITWFPPKLKIMRKALLSTHKGQVKDLLQPHHVTLDCNDETDLDESVIMDKIGFSSGTKLHETKKEAYTAPTNISSDGGLKAMGRDRAWSKGSSGSDQPVACVRTIVKTPTAAKKSIDVQWVDADEANNAIKAVKLDSEPTDWMLCGYQDVKTLKLIGSGSGGVAEMISHLDDEQVFYSFFRVTETYDKTVAVKFVFMKLMCNKVSPVKRAKMSVHAGFLKDYFSPVHVDFDITSRDEISPEIVSQKIGTYTGTYSKVTNKGESFLVRQASRGRLNSVIAKSGDSEYVVPE